MLAPSEKPGPRRSEEPLTASRKKHVHNGTTFHISRTNTAILSALIIALVVAVVTSFLRHNNEMIKMGVLVEQHEQKLTIILPANERMIAQNEEILRRLDRIDDKLDK